MSNFLALASVTATLGYLLEEVNRFVPGIKITTKPLDAVDLQHPVNGLNVFLYRVELSSAFGSIDLPVRDASGALENNPVLALDLHFLITPYASENDDIVSQQILASAINVLNNSPILAAGKIREAIRGKEGLESSDLAEQVESIKLSMDRMTFDEMSRVWSRFPNTNYRPSVSYTATTVILDSALPRRFIPSVKRIATDADQLLVPYLEKVEPSNVEFSKDARITILGRNLKSEDVVVRFGEKGDSYARPKQDTAGTNSISDRKILVDLPPSLSPGFVKVRVEHHFSPFDDRGAAGEVKNASHKPQQQQQQQKQQSQQQGKHRNNPKVVTSNGAAFVLAPRIVSPSPEKMTVVSVGKEFTIEFEPGISPERQNDASIMIGDNEIRLQRSLSHQGDKHKEKEEGPIGKITRLDFTIPQDIKPGTYLLRLRIGEGESMPTIDENPRSATFMQYIGPLIKVV